MSNQIRIAMKALGAILLLGLAAFCGYGFLASFEPGFGSFPNVFHVLYAGTGIVAIIGAVFLSSHALSSIAGT
jgi:hypothetical protein